MNLGNLINVPTKSAVNVLMIKPGVRAYGFEYDSLRRDGRRIKLTTTLGNILDIIPTLENVSLEYDTLSGPIEVTIKEIFSDPRRPADLYTGYFYEENGIFILIIH